jgi:hypothetical protein
MIRDFPCYNCGKGVSVTLPDFFGEVAADAVLATCPDCAVVEHLKDGGLISIIAEPPAGCLFHPGDIQTTKGAARALADARQSAASLVERHSRGDWGKLGSFEKTKVTEKQVKAGYLSTDVESKQNKISILGGSGQVMSSYMTSKGVEIWVITEIRDPETRARSGNSTSVMLPDEY